MQSHHNTPAVLRFSDLDVAAVRHRDQQRDRQLILYYALRTTPDGARGHAERSTIQSARTSLGISRRTCQRLVAHGTPVFWTPDRTGGLYLRAPARVAAALGVRSFRAAIVCPLMRLRGPIATVRARLALQGVAAIRRGLPISNASIASMLCTSARTVRLWTRRAGVRVRPKFALVAPLSKTSSVAEFFYATGEPGLRAVRYRGRTWLARQLPNSFSVPPSRGVRSRLRRAKRHLRRLTVAQTSSGISGGGTAARYRAIRRRARPWPDPSIPLTVSDDMMYVPVGVGRMSGKEVSLWEPGGRPRELGGKP